MHQSLERGVRSLFAPDTHGNRPSNFGYCKRHGTARRDARHQSSEDSGRQPAAPRLNPVTVQCRAGQVIRPIRQLRKQKRSSVKHAVTAARARARVCVCVRIYIHVFYLAHSVLQCVVQLRTRQTQHTQLVEHREQLDQIAHTAENATLISTFLCLSRACLGKVVALLV